MTAPALKVECAFDSGVSTAAASRTWTDVTTYVIGGVQIPTFGRQDEFSTTNPNTLQLTLDNSDGRFTAGLATGAYYPNVKLRRPVRVTVTPAGGSAVVRYVGYVDQWPIEWPGVVGSFATCALTATSRTALLGVGAELRSIVEEEYLLDSPAAYYTMGEPEGSTQANDSSGNHTEPLRMIGTGTDVVFGTATGPGTDGLTAATFAGGKYLQAAISTAGSTSVEVESFASPTEDGGLVEISAPSGIRLSLLVLPGGEIYAQIVGTGGSALEVTGSAVDDGTVRHFAARATLAGGTMTLILYVDGVSLTPDSGVIGSSLDFTTLTVGACPAASIGTVVGGIAHAAVFTSSTTFAIIGTRIHAHADAGLNGFTPHGDGGLEETPASRLARYAAYAGVPAAECDFETGQVIDLAHIDTTGKTALTVMREVETTESGVLFDAPDGTLTFHDRSHRYGAASVLTVNVADGELDPSYAPNRDDFGMLNDVTATNADGITARVVDQGSIDDYGNYRQSVDLATTNADEPLMRAGWLTGSYAEPSTRVPTLTIELAKLSAARQATVLAVGVGDRITVTNLMDQSDASSKVFFVEGYAEQPGGVGGLHPIVFNLSPAAVSDVWILGQSELGVDTRLAY